MSGLDGDDWARFVYLGILLVFLIGALRSRKAFRDLAIWVLIFAMVVIAYGFRDTLRDELLPAAMVTRPDGAIELRRRSDGHFQAEALVNGVPVRFLVDTGASEVVLSAADARQVGFEPSDLQFVGRAQTANGVVATAPVRLATFELGDFRDADVRASVGGGALDVSLLGMSYLDRFASIFIEGDRMTLRR